MMTTFALPAASLRSACRLPADRVWLLVSKYLACIVLSANRWAIFREESIFLPESREAGGPGGSQEFAPGISLCHNRATTAEPRRAPMKVANAVAEILKREGIEFLIGYPVNPIIEAAAEADIRTIMVRQERIGLHMCDALAKVTSGDKIGVFVMQHGPGTENAFGGVAQSYGDSCPVVVLPAGYARNINQVHPNFNAALNYRNVTKLCEQVTVADATVEALRRAFTTVRNGRPGPVLVEFPADILRDEVPDALVELLEAPVMTTLGGKSAFPENHPLSLGSGGIGIGGHLWHFLQNADFIFGIGCSFTRSSFATAMPKSKRIAHATLDPYAINKDVPVDLAAVGDAGLTLDMLLEEVK